MKKELKLYVLLDTVLMPKVWLNLEAWQLNFEPLYQGDYQLIAEAIPYLIELDQSVNSRVVKEFFTSEDYHSALFICSYFSIEELVKRLAFFYHVEDDRGIPYLRRFFDI
ncbi:DUF4123 domain-containing protein [Rodentibacter myodis]|uniref:DUF4123 domain-containing protein n=1 Tax=Rodentibacter myodis TaxID=1907939 RepID=A0A1V3JTH4_9PAST|nr:DUF4123 domain-containing protein [Rodentibacter myodis]OOF59995.1 hypothetical protein BKL49_01410 [Rodentibacter myodis]